MGTDWFVTDIDSYLNIMYFGIATIFSLHGIVKTLMCLLDKAADTEGVSTSGYRSVNMRGVNHC